MLLHVWSTKKSIRIVPLLGLVEVPPCVVRIAACALLLSAAGVESAACAAGVVQADVTSAADAEALVSMLSCTGGGVFDVQWTGSVPIAEPFNVSGGSSLTVTGASSSVLDDNSSGVAVVDGQGNDGIFDVSGASTLSLNNLILAGGNSSTDGGAIHVTGADVFVTDCGFQNNSATGYGGAVYGNNSRVAISDTVAFTSNLAIGDGGAMYTDSSSIAIQDNVTFDGNAAENRGGAIRGSFSNFTVDDAVRFTNNTSVKNGGAINSWFSKFTFRGDPVFDNNAAAGDGGGISAYQTDLTIFDGLAFVNNSAGGYGGALDVAVCVIIIDGDAAFHGNLAKDGGAIFLYQAVAHLRGGSFSDNSAVQSGGAMSLSQPTEVTLYGVLFVSNTADIGGAIALTSTGEEPTQFEACTCTFDSNSAVDGGALYMSTNGGMEVVRNCNFYGNRAGESIERKASRTDDVQAALQRVEISGGTIFHTGHLGMIETVFASNEAGQDGTAVFSMGVVQKALNVAFASNTLNCPPGENAYDKEAEDDSCRFELACARCSADCDAIPSSVTMADSTIPVCVESMEGTKASSSGTTVATLDLQEGYYRTSAESQVVVECYLTSACAGGTDPKNYCADGYEGPYCSVCADGYAPGTAYQCHECSGTSMGSAVGVAAAVVAVVLLMVAVVAADLVRVVDGDDSIKDARTLKGRLSRFHAFVVTAFPLTTVKIVVVAWQIITQFGAIAGFVYPEEYQDFLNALTPVNLDIGFILSYSCVVITDFFDRLLIATIGPVVVLALLALTFVVGRKRNIDSEAAVRAVKNKHLSAALFVMFFIYSSVSFTVFQTFVCDTLDDGVSYLRADYSLTCDTPRYGAFRGYAAVMVCVYPIGIPATFAWLLGSNRQDLQKADRDRLANLQPLGDLWEAYKPSRYYYEIIEYVRRIVLTGVAVFVLPGSSAQMAVVLLLAVVFLFISESLSPFTKKIDMALYRWGNGVVLASIYVALLLKVNVSEEGSETLSAFVVVLILANVCMAITLVVQSFLLVREWRSSTVSAR
ncbi:unnamed protein product [Ectocarpus sp. CCAP 1310/34]|nr:unnamed protein product [Ectocarpus sp. CCAP 1310/34]